MIRSILQSRVSLVLATFILIGCVASTTISKRSKVHIFAYTSDHCSRCVTDKPRMEKLADVGYIVEFIHPYRPKFSLPFYCIQWPNGTELWVHNIDLLELALTEYENGCRYPGVDM